jgi:hypothetical protein
MNVKHGYLFNCPTQKVKVRSSLFPLCYKEDLWPTMAAVVFASKLDSIFDNRFRQIFPKESEESGIQATAKVEKRKERVSQKKQTLGIILSLLLFLFFPSISF